MQSQGVVIDDEVVDRPETIDRWSVSRLPTWARTDRFWGWAGPIIIMIFGGIMRFWRLDDPHKLIFDETYYVKEANSFLRYGVEMGLKTSLSQDPNKRNAAADQLFNAGNLDIHGSTPEFVVHPPLGKWMIAVGEWLFGSTSSWGWRFSAAVVGTLAILMIGRIARRLFGSTLLGAIASLLLALDGQELVHSRVSVLDIFVMFWALAAFGCLLVDRDVNRRRLAERVAERSGERVGEPPGGRRARRASAKPSGTPFGRPSGKPSAGWTGMRWWRIAGMACLAACTAVKWSGLYFTAMFLVMSVLWDLSARRRLGLRRPIVGALVRDGGQALVSAVVVIPTLYLSTWFGWFHSGLGWDRHWADTNPAHGIWTHVPNALRSLLHYHSEMLTSASSITTPHNWQANPWAWMVLGRPTLMWNDIFHSGQSGCTASSCNQMITDLGNPLIWWPGTLALGVLLFRWALARDWRAGAVLSGIVGGYLPWFQYQQRTIFEFYAVAFGPWVVLGVVYCIGLVLRPSTAPVPAGAGTVPAGTVPAGGTAPDGIRPHGTALIWGAADRRRWTVVGVYLVLVVVVCWFFYPITAGQVIPSGELDGRRWLTSWF